MTEYGIKPVLELYYVYGLILAPLIFPYKQIFLYD